MLQARDLSLSFPQRPLFSGASLAVEKGDRIALVGDNGAGKSTLLSVLAGERAPDEGAVERVRGVRVGLLSQEPKLDPQASVVEVARSGLGDLFPLIDEHARLCAHADVPGAAERIAELGEQIEARGGFDVAHRVETVLSRLGVPLREEPVQALSGGGRRRLDLARLLLSDPDVLLLDEPTNHLDVAGIKFLAERLRAHRGAVLFVSHDRAFIDEVATKIAELDGGKLYPHPVPYADFLENRLTRQDIAERTHQKKERLMARELAWLRAGTPARTTKQTARIERAEQLIDDVKREVHELREKRIELLKTREQRLGKTILEMDEVAVERGGRTLFSGLTLKLVEGERWGVVGPNGTGKTSLLGVIRGDLAPARGTVTRGPHTKIATFDQHRADLDPEATLEETLAADNDHVFVDGKRMHVASWLERFLFQGSDRARRVKTLSGGEQNRLILARLFLQGANCLLLDEPTNDLDVATLQVLESAVRDHEGVVLVVSHDRRFLDRVVTGILAFEDGVVIPVQGDWTNYERWAAERVAKAAAPAPVVEKAAATRTREKKKRSYKEQREYEEIEANILTAEEKRDALQAELADGTVFRTDPKRAAGLQPALDAANAEVERLYARWAELAELDPS